MFIYGVNAENAMFWLVIEPVILLTLALLFGLGYIDYSSFKLFLLSSIMGIIIFLTSYFILFFLLFCSIMMLGLVMTLVPIIGERMCLMI